MTDLFAAPATLPRPALHLGQAVHVNARTAWLPATVISIAHTRIGIAYAAELPVSIPLADAVVPWVVRPADGVRLRPVHALCSGDDLVAADGSTVTVATAWQGRDRWWVISFIDGQRAVVPPNTIVRLTDPTPQVSVNGIPL
ncbi:hypothetical protein Ais01nite_73880 [Asanoa ishikariensis]|uniref:Uncharacterized protein n=1 Tax=Asanoa ishikariensis TaxID=137265 RepID=A0A1H3URR4_9ACTN|nr:hypothetical protein [Asanoa ishikariensis]GIF69353.1 hypothetical protein Ais01nite_73880 [Asanoa ishikariensis]SDZ65047.1 hypothetical protein SAMN05421684_7912 [Asanoa ishikariensis]